MNDEPGGTFKNRLQAGHLESLMTMSRGVAHDFNNLLAAVLGNTLIAKRFLPEDYAARESFEQIEQCATRALELSRKLAIYAGSSPLSPMPVDMAAIIESALEELRAEGVKLPDLDTRLQDGLPPVRGDAQQLARMVRGLLTNAAEALVERAGHLSVATSLFDYDAQPLNPVHPDHPEPGRYVRIRIADTGKGISRSVQKRMFEPFFTTKIRGEGLGLCVVLGVVRTHRGIIMVDSRLHRGSALTVMLPVGEMP